MNGNLAGTKFVLEQIIPYLSEKRPQAKIVRDFCERRLVFGYTKRPERTRRGQTSYVSADLAAINSLRRLNFRGTRDHLCGFPELISVRPPSWRGNGVVCANFKQALRTFDIKHSG
jgi:hypothetical protein